jgi:predicted DNA binding CopG/RHH family protein
MKNKKKHIDPIPDEFASYEEAAEFWDTHDTTDYLEVFKTVKVKTELRKRHYEVEVDAEIIKELRKRAQQKGIPTKRLVNDMLRRQISLAA